MLCILTAVVIALVPFSDGDDGIVDWSEAVAVVFDDGGNATCFNSIQGAIDSIESGGTVYVVVRDGAAVPISDTILIPNGRYITITGIEYSESPPAKPSGCEVTIVRSQGLTGAMAEVSSQQADLTLENVILDGGASWDQDGNNIGLIAEDAAVFVNGGYFTLGAGSSIENNHNDSTDKLGGAVRAIGGMIDICGRITGNTSAGVSAAMYIEHTIVFLGDGKDVSLNFSNNTANGTDDLTWAPIVMDPSSSITVNADGVDYGSVPYFIRITSGLSETYGTYNALISLSPIVKSGFGVYIEPSRPEGGFIINNSDYETTLISVTLSDGFQLGTKIGSGNLEIINDDGFTRTYDNETWYANSISSDQVGTDIELFVPIDGEEQDETAPAAGFLVRLYEKGSDDVLYAGLTNQDGIVRFDAPNGEYRIMVDGDEHDSVFYFDFIISIPNKDAIVLSQPSIENHQSQSLYISGYTTYPGSVSHVVYEVADSPSVLNDYVEGSILLELDIQPQDETGTDLEYIDGLLMTTINLRDLIELDRISNPLVLRIHNGSVDEIPQDIPNSYGEYFTINHGLVEGNQIFVTIYSNRFSTYAIADGTYTEPEPPSPPVERTYVWAAIEDRQVRISVDPESGRQYCVKDSAGNELMPWNSAHNGSTFSFDLLPPGADYSVVSRYSTSGAERTDAVIRAPIDPSIVIDSVGPDMVSLVAEDGAEYRLTGPGFAGEWTSDPSWSGLDPSADYYAEARSVSGSLSITTGPEVVKPGLEVAGAARHDEVRVALSLPDGWTFSVADGLVATGNSLGPVPPGILQVEVNPPAGTGFTFELLIPEIPEDSPDTAESVSFESQEGVMYLLTDSSGTDAGDGWVQGGGTLSWTVDPEEGYFLSMSTEIDGIPLQVTMIEIKRPSEAAGFEPR